MRILPITDTDELYCHYTNQTSPQDVFLEIDPEDETISMRYNPEKWKPIILE